MKMQNMKRSETTEQMQLFAWAKRTESILPELKLLYHVPNEGKRTNGAILKAAGLKSGVPDICLPVAFGNFHGLYIELKFGSNKPTQGQRDFMDLLKGQGYAVAVCYGAESARKTILDYLTEPGKMPKEICVNAPHFTNGTCDGVAISSRMFGRGECRECQNYNMRKAETVLKENMGHIKSGYSLRITATIIMLSEGEPIEGYTLEDTLETVNKMLAVLVRNNDLTVKQSAAVLTVAMEAYNTGKKARE
jgi:hypothetical protein